MSPLLADRTMRINDALRYLGAVQRLMGLDVAARLVVVANRQAWLHARR
jgi:hypothetical protein